MNISDLADTETCVRVSLRHSCTAYILLFQCTSPPGRHCFKSSGPGEHGSMRPFISFLHPPPLSPPRVLLWGRATFMCTCIQGFTYTLHAYEHGIQA